MAGIPRSTLEQWAVLRAIVKHGSYAAAAEVLNRSQSAVSYAIARLQDAMGGPLLELQGRRAVLTEAGATFLAEVEPLIEDLARVERRGRSALQGQAATLRVLVDSLFPKTRLYAALTQFVQHYPDVEVCLIETVKRTLQDVTENDYDIAILVADPGVRDTDLVAQIKLIAVAAASHPLVKTTRPLGKAALARYAYVQIHGIEDFEDEPRPLGRSWSMNTVDSAYDVVCHGLGYAWLPCERIQDALTDGRLKAINLKRGAQRNVALGMRVSTAAEGAVDDALSALANLLAEGG